MNSYLKGGEGVLRYLLRLEGLAKSGRLFGGLPGAGDDHSLLEITVDLAGLHRNVGTFGNLNAHDPTFV